MAEKHTHHHDHHHHHHHDYASANAELFSQHAANYRTEFSLELAKRCAGIILKNYSFDANQTEVLDFACGPGLIALELLPHAKRVVGADVAQGMVDVFNRTAEEQGIASDRLQAIRVDTLKGDSSDLNGAVFDVIFCSQAYHHFEDPVHITRALAQRLKPNGRLFVIDFLNDDGLDNLFGKTHEPSDPASDVVVHKHGFTSEQMIDMLKAADLHNPKVQNAFQMSASEMKTYQGHEVFNRVIDSHADGTLYYFIASGDKQ